MIEWFKSSWNDLSKKNKGDVIVILIVVSILSVFAFSVGR